MFTFVLLWMVCITTQTCSWTKKRCAKVVNRLKTNSCAYECKPSGHDDSAVRRQGVHWWPWLQIKSKYPEYRLNTIRKFMKPNINFSAHALKDLIFTRSTDHTFEYQPANGDWELITMSLLLSFSEVKDFVSKPYKTEYPCHTQMVEMNVKLTTFVTKQLIGNKRQVGQGLAIVDNIAILKECKPNKIAKDYNFLTHI